MTIKTKEITTLKLVCVFSQIITKIKNTLALRNISKTKKQKHPTGEFKQNT